MSPCCCCPALFSYVPTDFFETSATLITFILLGKYLECAAKVQGQGGAGQGLGAGRGKEASLCGAAHLRCVRTADYSGWAGAHMSNPGAHMTL